MSSTTSEKRCQPPSYSIIPVFILAHCPSAMYMVANVEHPLMQTNPTCASASFTSQMTAILWCYNVLAWKSWFHFMICQVVPVLVEPAGSQRIGRFVFDPFYIFFNICLLLYWRICENEAVIIIYSHSSHSWHKMGCYLSLLFTCNTIYIQSN